MRYKKNILRFFTFILISLVTVLSLLCYFQEYSVNMLWNTESAENDDFPEFPEVDEDCDFANKTDLWTDLYDNILEYF